jgi:hypothetical protein
MIWLTIYGLPNKLDMKCANPGILFASMHLASLSFFAYGASATPRNIVLPAGLFVPGQQVRCITDGPDQGFRKMDISASKQQPITLTMAPLGGFVLAAE